MKKTVIKFLFLILIVAGCIACLREKALSPNIIGSTLVSPIDGMTMVFVLAGEFKMGADPGLTDEQPVHTVMLDSYWLDKTEVTNAMYHQCVRDGKCDKPDARGSYEDPVIPMGYFDDPESRDHPVVFVSWNDAKKYCAWAGRRLPTEAEWEKAAIWNPITKRQQIYPWGNEFNCKMGNYDDETLLDASLMPDTPPNCDGFPRSSPVGSFPQGASPYGALDMGGNVWEWVNDAFIETDPFTDYPNYYAISPVYNPPGVDPAISEYRVLRGGSWNFTYGEGRSAYRLWHGLNDSYDGIGFRCAKSE